MVAYLERRARKTFRLRICERPCNGAEYAASPFLDFADKKGCRDYCAARGIQPWNF